MKKLIIAIVVIALAGAGIYFLTKSNKLDLTNNQNTGTTTPSTDDQNMVEEPKESGPSVIGKSVEGREITAYHYGQGDTELLFIGGMHGGYSWNTVLVAYELMDYLGENPDLVPENVRVTVIPVLNPDGLNKVVGTASRFSSADVPSSQAATIPGRFNAHNVDINRNFDCDWQQAGTWQNRTVSGGSQAFSEPESQALRNFVEANKPTAVIIWFSAAGGVYASNCHNGISSETRAIMKTYADASGYPAYESFDFYKTTGDVANWLAKNNIPAASVILTNHTDIEWNKNKAGIDALLEYYAE
jgi:hypothetical protein